MTNNSNNIVDYNVNVVPILAEYNHVNNHYDGVRPLIPSYSTNDNNYSLASIRGAGLYNPAPEYIQTIDRGNAFSNIKSIPSSYLNTYAPIEGELFVNPSGAVEIKNSWDTNTNANIKTPSQDNYDYYDEYQRWALNATRLSDPYILPFLFSKINVKFIQDSVKKYVKENRNINIKTEQDVNGLLTLMLRTYTLYYNSIGILGTNDCATKPADDKVVYFQSVLGHLNKEIIEKYVQSVLSGLNMNEYYLKDISQLPVPLTKPVATSNKGSKELGFVGFFEDNQDFTRKISSFNIRDGIPGKLNSLNFGN